MEILITGGAGFIGSHLAERLLGEGHRVVALDDLSTGSLDNLCAAFDYPGFGFVQGSVLEVARVARLIERSDLVVHLAAAVGVRYVLDHPIETIKTNVHGTDNILEAATQFGKKVLMASTSEIYGKNTADALCESADSILGPATISRWSYATTKKIDEFLALAYAESYHLPVVITRFFNIVGPRQAGRYGMVLPSFARAALAGEPIRVFGDGRQTRNFTFIEDCVEALVRLLFTDSAEGAVFNIGGPHEISIMELAGRVKEITGSASPILLVPYAKAYQGMSFEDMRRRVPCICKIQRLTGWSPQTTIDEMIRRTVQYECRPSRRGLDAAAEPQWKGLVKQDQLESASA